MAVFPDVQRAAGDAARSNHNPFQCGLAQRYQVLGRRAGKAMKNRGFRWA
tara:strand:- start:1427 stop:1576 length:150 start_codon:yes stop_codon:yes gene_type:complete